jgi:murein DD-endopeptidase MepM/ murein hydrolase activator NlpD
MPLKLCIVLLLAGIAACRGGPTAPSPGPIDCNPSASSARIVNPIFGKPFQGDYPTATLFDHDKPLPLGDGNTFVLSTCGVRVRNQREVNGHDGYDWHMPEGTPLFAVADGQVVLAGPSAPTLCPPLGRTVESLVVALRHVDTNGDTFLSIYGHLSRVDVAEGQTVSDGAAIGLSGNTGCSVTPHLHFGAMRPMPDDRYVVIDPFGWHSASTDPWEADLLGARSVWLWRDGAAPSLR